MSMMGANGGPVRSPRPLGDGQRLLAGRPLQVHATTNTVAPPLHDHAQLPATSAPLCRHQEIMDLYEERAPVRKKRGPKAGRKAALAAAAATANDAQQPAWLGGASGDPYAFQCDSSKPSASITLGHQVSARALEAH